MIINRTATASLAHAFGVTEAFAQMISSDRRQGERFIRSVIRDQPARRFSRSSAPDTRRPVRREAA